jgi:hypothetical protein
MYIFASHFLSIRQSPTSVQPCIQVRFRRGDRRGVFMFSARRADRRTLGAVQDSARLRRDDTDCTLRRAELVCWGLSVVFVVLVLGERSRASRTSSIRLNVVSTHIHGGGQLELTRHSRTHEVPRRASPAILHTAQMSQSPAPATMQDHTVVQMFFIIS